MKKFINRPENVVEGILQGFAILSAALRAFIRTLGHARPSGRDHFGQRQPLRARARWLNWRRSAQLHRGGGSLHLSDTDSRHAFTSLCWHVDDSLLKDAWEDKKTKAADMKRHFFDSRDRSARGSGHGGLHSGTRDDLCDVLSSASARI
jgi:hypothetical protein